MLSNVSSLVKVRHISVKLLAEFRSRLMKISIQQPMKSFLFQYLHFESQVLRIFALRHCDAPYCPVTSRSQSQQSRTKSPNDVDRVFCRLFFHHLHAQLIHSNYYELSTNVVLLIIGWGSGEVSQAC